MFTISFDFDETTKKIKNLKVVSIEPGLPTVQTLENKLQLSPSAIELIGVKPGDRLSINYWTVNNRETFPLIGKAETFNEEGTKLTKSNTISYRGQQMEVLNIYGTNFTLQPFKEGMFKLVSVKEDSLENEMIDLENTENLTFNDFNEE
jgi:hypothetical protein